LFSDCTSLSLAALRGAAAAGGVAHDADSLAVARHIHPTVGALCRLAGREGHSAVVPERGALLGIAGRGGKP